MQNQLRGEILKFKKWSEKYSDIPESQRLGEWEEEYKGWEVIEELFKEFLKTENYTSWSIDDIINILYLVARDNEMEEFIEYIIEEQPKSLEVLAKNSFEFGERNAKWQIAINLDKNLNIENQKKYLEKYLGDEDEYVRRIALLEIGKLNHPRIEEYCLRAWNENHEYQRIAVLHALKNSNSSQLEHYFKLAKEDGRKYLVMNVNKLIEE